MTRQSLSGLVGTLGLMLTTGLAGCHDGHPSPTGGGGAGDESATGGDGPTAGATAGDAQMGGTPSVLPDPMCVDGMPTAEELLATPREDRNIELLALRFSTGVVADEAIYDRLVRDIGAIRVDDPSLADIPYHAENSGDEVSVELAAEAFEEMQQGTYTAWDCLNDAYTLRGIDVSTTGSHYATLRLEGIYSVEKVAAQYASLPGVLAAGPSQGGDDGPTICVTLESDNWHYVFDRAGGDCQLGCDVHDYTYFTTDTDGNLTSHGEPSPTDIETYASREACDRTPSP